jgi:hypothetical protein
MSRMRNLNDVVFIIFGNITDVTSAFFSEPDILNMKLFTLFFAALNAFPQELG